MALSGGHLPLQLTLRRAARGIDILQRIKGVAIFENEFVPATWDLFIMYLARRLLGQRWPPGLPSRYLQDSAASWSAALVASWPAADQLANWSVVG